MSSDFRQFQRLTASKLNRAINESGAQAGEAAAQPYATAAAASATAASASETAAAASVVAAEAAVSAALGPVAKVTTTGTSSAYSITASHGASANRSVWVRFHTTNAAHPVNLTWNGTTRSLRQADSGVLIAGMLPVNEDMLVLDNGTTFNVYRLDDITRAFTQMLIIRDGTFNFDHYKAAADANARSRIQMSLTSNLGVVTIRSGGDGTSVAGATLAALSDNSTRVYGDLTVDGAATVGGDRVLVEDDPSLAVYASPLTAPNIKHIVGAPSRMNNRTSPQRISATSYYQVGGLDQHRAIVYANGAWVDFMHMPKGGTVNLIPSSAGAVCYLYTGEGEWSGNGVTAATLTAHSWVNTSTKILQGSAGAYIRVTRNGAGASFLATCDYGSVSDGTGAVMPSHDVVVGWGPQSWGVDMRQNSAAGWQPRMVELGLGTNAYFPDTANVGASTLLYFAAKSTLYYWDPDTDTPGQRLIDMSEAIKADRTARTALMGTTAPAMSVMCWFEGLNLMGSWGPSSTHPLNCPQVYTESMVKAFQWLDADLGYSLKYFVIPLTSQKLGTFDETLWHAVRMAQLRAPAAGAAAVPPVDIVIAPEVYGDPRAGDEEAEAGERHYDFPVHAVVASRMCDAWGNETAAQSNHLGATIDSVVTADGGAGLVWDVIIDYGDGRAFNSAAIPHLGGFRLLPAATGSVDTDDFATPLTIASVAWAGAGGAPLIALRVTLDTPYLAGTPRPSVLWGSAYATDDIDTLIYTLHPETAKRMYLRQYLSGG